MPDIQVHPECAGRVNGGTKNQWLRLHRPEIESYYHVHGPDDTKIRFNMTDKTFYAFWQRQSEDVKLNKLSEADRWVMRICNAGTAEVRRRVNELEDWRADVEPVIEAGRILIQATSTFLEAKVGNTALLEAANRLNNSGEKSKK